MIKKFSHVGIAVKNLDRVVEFFQGNYGAKLVWRKKFDKQRYLKSIASRKEEKK